MKKLIHVANIAILNEEGEVLLLKRSQNLRQPGFWGLVGGLIDAGELESEAVVRELWEETRIGRESIELGARVKFLIEKEEEDVEITLFKAKLIRPVEIVLDEYEHDEWQWIRIEELQSMERLMGGVPIMVGVILMGKSYLGTIKNDGPKISIKEDV